ncbi:hypothetical protein MiSe_70180 [Microseira wollei NIES-4236]|uniref:Uncharacterized protein n=1 Tax=Microseira wollei NIES-4236 TaxID=2530354 RepID=A0AAV3WLW9_9CYAN|nr:hypothetical protein MiSe_70180 [Microseira wollei NIES-4236]
MGNSTDMILRKHQSFYEKSLVWQPEIYKETLVMASTCVSPVLLLWRNRETRTLGDQMLLCLWENLATVSRTVAYNPTNYTEDTNVAISNSKSPNRILLPTVRNTGFEG